jgi:hypothetical protein
MSPNVRVDPSAAVYQAAAARNPAPFYLVLSAVIAVATISVATVFMSLS